MDPTLATSLMELSARVGGLASTVAGQHALLAEVREEQREQGEQLRTIAGWLRRQRDGQARSRRRGDAVQRSWQLLFGAVAGAAANHLGGLAQWAGHLPVLRP